MGICKVKIEHNNKQKICKFFVLTGNGKALLGMPHIDILNIIQINCNTIDIQETDTANNCSTNTAICHGSRHEQHYTNMMQEADRAEKWYVNTDSISNFDNKEKPTVTDKECNTINYFLPGPNQDNDKRVSAEITQQLQRDFKDVFTGIGCFDGAFSLQKIPDSKLDQAPLKHVAYALQKSFKEELK